MGLLPACSKIQNDKGKWSLTPLALFNYIIVPKVGWKMVDRVQAILNNPVYHEYMLNNQEREQQRIFCKHGWEHSFDVARAAYILVLEAKCTQDQENDQANCLTKELVYAAALLHDIGRWKQYDEGVDHAQVGAELAVNILQQAGFHGEEITIIREAISYHRCREASHSILGTILYNADKIVRPCYRCMARVECNKIGEMEKHQAGRVY
jgi:putative nucleotidyltransferase with HDIG domain